MQREIDELKQRFENEKNGLSQSQNELRDMYEKRIAEIKAHHTEEMRKTRDEQEKRLKEEREKSESEIRE